MQKIINHSKFSLINRKRAGRKAKHDRGVRHIKRERFFKDCSFHITIKVKQNKADIQNKQILKGLHRAILKARRKGVRVIHYTLEYNHVHLLVEASNNLLLSKAMQSFGITFAKYINKVKRINGDVYKQRHHLRKINGPLDLKHVLHYIFYNGVKHKSTNRILSVYNSAIAETRLKLLYPKLAWPHQSSFFRLQSELFILLDPGRIYFKRLVFDCLKTVQ